ncbi:hypothetical protein ACONUD_03260 [Microbulbifer harenosus]|uniref:Uncharacterized protein n=1 Tax=Microbulbifer harenosus TaxID=2576840 RepID=A0ABY2UM32_9GAMM|nr:hypothetical protein [Microbulbifer harenosus]TLM78367.1 hypothetical protein FDY93_06115 [Microbulbifer harenosus]
MANQTDWLQRYVDNVRTYLPARLREDVGNELYSDLQDQRDELEESLGRMPTESEILKLLKQRGHPMAVAAAYQPRRTLVSEPLFPLYLQVLKWTLLVLAVLGAVGTVGSLYGDEHPKLVSAAIGWFAGLYESGIHAFAWVTLVFYLAGEGLSYRRVFADWNPRTLPNVVDSGRRIKRFDSALEFVVTLLAMAWLNDMWLLPGTGGNSSLSLSVEFTTLLPWLNFALGASVLMSLYKLFSPFWTRRRLLTDAALNSYWLVMLAMLLGLNAPFSLEWHNGEFWQPSQGGWQVAIGVVIAITAWDLFENIRGLLHAYSGRDAEKHV